VELIVIFLAAANEINLLPLPLDSSCKLSDPIVGFYIVSFPIFVLKSPITIFDLSAGKESYSMSKLS